MSGTTTQILFLVVIIAAFYFLIIRPQQQRTKQQADMISSLTPGAEIMSIGGIYGTIISIEDDRLLVELHDGTQLELAKRAVAQVVAPKAPVVVDEDVEDEPEMADEGDESAETPAAAADETDSTADKGDATDD